MRDNSLNGLRQQFLDFFNEKDHIIMHSFPLIPQDDNSLLLINAGMAPLKKYFTGEKKFAKDRVATSQKCIRTQDIENVGKTQRHAAFFEMLGNFSFGDYFKKEAIAWAMEFLTEKMGLPKERLWATVYEEDDEAYELWRTVGQLPENRIQRLGKETNFWELELGPCGPCSEIFFDRGEKYMAFPEDLSPAADGERFIEVWNLVFTQFDRQPDGSYIPLAKPNIDTGMGLERLNLVMEEADNIFEVSSNQNLIRKIEEVTNKKYKVIEEEDISIRVLCDHAKAMTFLISDGVLPSNEGRGYVLRRLMRRAMRHGILLGMNENFMGKIIDAVITLYESGYPELRERQEMITRVVEAEEEKFRQTVTQGMNLLEGKIAQLKEQKEAVLSGADAFKLYDTYGFPIDLTREMLEEQGMTMNEIEFSEAMNEQRARSKAHGMGGSIGWEAGAQDALSELPKTEFIGYTEKDGESPIVAIYKDHIEIEEAMAGDEVLVVTQKSPFYGEGGGQAGDRGTLLTGAGKATVTDTKKTSVGAILHNVRVEEGHLKKGDAATLSVDDTTRAATMKNHSATHLLHAALRIVLGTHIEQAGSMVDQERLRFDFTHFQAITKDELDKIERIVNQKIAEAMPVTAIEKSLEEANAEGAIGLFEDKYQEVVRVLTMGDFSKELCGGTHVSNTAEIQMFHIVSESGISAGVRRIEAITGLGVYEFMRGQQKILDRVAASLKSQKTEIVDKVETLIEDNKQKDKEIQALQSAKNTGRVDEILQDTQTVEGISVATARVNDMKVDGLRELADRLRDKMVSGVVVLGTENEGKVQFVAAVSKDLVGQKLHAGNLVREVAKLTGGNGGGRPDMATAGGKDASQIDFALSKVCDIIKVQIV